MKKVVNKHSLNGWRKPTKSELKSIRLLDKDLKYEMNYHIVCIIVSIIACGILYKVVDIIELSMVISIIIVVMVQKSLEVLNIRYIRNTIKNKKYSIESCYVHHFERKLKMSGLKICVSRLAFIHNDLDEYCKEPIEVDEELEYSINIDKDAKLALLNIENKIYKIVEIV